MFFELSDENDNNYIDPEEMKWFFAKNLINEEDAKTARLVAKDFLFYLQPS